MPASVWKGHITFGLVSVPVRLFRAARKETVRLHHVRSEPELESRRGSFAIAYAHLATPSFGAATASA
jgi:DNA end-binding protein Ku